MRRKRTLVFAAAVLVSLVAVGAALASGYWFYQGTLSGATQPFSYPQDGNPDYARMSFNNSPIDHLQKIVVIDNGGSWTGIGVNCPSGSGCDSGDIAIDSSYYPKGGCENPTYNPPAYTNCKYNKLHP